MDERTDQLRTAPAGTPNETDVVIVPGETRETVVPAGQPYEAGAVEMQETHISLQPTGNEAIAVQRAQIEETRAEMSETIDALKEKLDPQVLADQAKESVREATIGRAEDAMHQAASSAQEMWHEAESTARGAGTSMIEAIKENPMPAALIGIGAGWLLMNARKAHDGGATQGAYYGRQGHHGPSGDLMGKAADTMSRTADRVQSRTDEMTDMVRDRASDTAHSVQQTADDMSHKARQGAQQASQGFQDMLRENPLGVGAIALALGAAVGFAVPETRVEDRWMGETRDSMVDQVSQRAQDMAGKVETVAKEAMTAARQEARKTAQEEGLTG